MYLIQGKNWSIDKYKFYLREESGWYYYTVINKTGEKNEF